MYRPWSQRVRAAVFALWFALAGFEPGVVAACPMHSAGAAATAAAGPAGPASDHSGHDLHGRASATTGHATAVLDADGSGATDSPASSCCSCPGCGCAAPMLVMPSALADDVGVAPFASPPAAPRVVRAWNGDVVLPFSTAPPALVTA
jgi:hypothetical protein